MTVVKSNLCPTCGGLLNIDLDKQMYICPFCGVSFDYEYFREDNVKEVASRSVARSEYGAAKDAYEFMLKKDPHDFEALRGLFLCKNKWKTIHPMLRDSDVHIKPDEPTLQNAIENALPEHREYFEKIREALGELSHYRELKEEAQALDIKRIAAVKALNHIKDEYYINDQKFTTAFRQTAEWNDSKGASVIAYIVVISALLFGLLIYFQVWWFFIALAAIIISIVTIYNVKKAITAKRLIASMGPADEKIKELTALQKAKSVETEQSHSRYNMLVKEFMAMDPMPQKAPEKYSIIRKRRRYG